MGRRGALIRKSFLSNITIYSIVLPLCVVCGLLFGLNWKLALVLLLFLVVMPFNYLFPDLALLPIFFVIPFDRLARIGPESYITFAKILLGPLIVVWFFKTLTVRDTKPITRFVGNYLFYLSLLFLVFSFVSIINSNHDDIFLLQTIRRVSVVIFFWIIINYLNKKDLLLKVLKVLLLAYTLVGFIGIYEIYTQESILKTYWGEEETKLEYTLSSDAARISGPGGDPDFLAISVIFPSFIACFFFFRSKSKLWKLMLILFFTLMLINMIGTGSRGGLLSFLIGLTVLWIFSKMRYKYVLAILTVVGIAVVIFAMEVMSPELPADRYAGGGTQSINYRLGWMKMAFSMIKDHPIIGIGTRNVIGKYNRYIQESPVVPRSRHWIHNSFLQMWAENGICGFLVYVSIYVLSAGMMWIVIKKSTDLSTRTLGVLFLAVVASYFIFAGTSNVLENENYWIVFAMCNVVYNFYKNETNNAVNPEESLQAY